MQNVFKMMIVTDGLGHSAALRALPRFAWSLNSEKAPFGCKSIVSYG
jgi:hypothetical protein